MDEELKNELHSIGVFLIRWGWLMVVVPAIIFLLVGGWIMFAFNLSNTK